MRDKRFKMAMVTGLGEFVVEMMQLIKKFGSEAGGSR